MPKMEACNVSVDFALKLRNLKRCQLSDISLTTPTTIGKRALQGEVDRRSEASERAKRWVGQRYVLHADIARFYASIYTHSIPWAIYGKSNARARWQECTLW